MLGKSMALARVARAPLEALSGSTWMGSSLHLSPLDHSSLQTVPSSCQDPDSIN